MIKSLRSMKVKKRMADISIFTGLLLGSVLMIAPLIWMITTSLKSKLEVFEIPPVWIPKAPRWENYINVWGMGPLLQGFINSSIIAVTVVTVGTITSALAAFAFSKLRFPHKDKIFLALLGTMMIPFPIVMIPQFVMYTRIGWIDTLYPLIVPGLFGNVMMIFFLKQYMSGIPDSLIEAAIIDGSSFLGIFWKIMLPLTKPAIAAQAILWFMAIWNDYLAPSIYINSTEKMPIQVVIASFNAYYAIQSDYAMIMAASVISMIPILVIFALFQRQIIESVAMTGMK